MKLNVKAFALTCAIIWGLGLFLMTWWLILFDGATTLTRLIRQKGYLRMDSTVPERVLGNYSLLPSSPTACSTRLLSCLLKSKE